MNNKSRILVFLLTVILFLGTLVGYVSDLTAYGATWDELIFHREVGKIYYEFLKTGRQDNFLKFANAAWFPPIAPTFGHMFVANNSLKKYIPDDTDRFHIAAIIFSSITISIVFLITYFLTRKISIAIIASILLASYPQFVTQAHNNVRDMGLTAFYSATILFLLLTVIKKKKLYWLDLAALIAGLTIATKQNGAFLIFIGLVWYVINIKKLKLRFLLTGIFLFVVLAGLTFFIFWPYLWVDTWKHLQLVWHFLNNKSVIAGSTVFYDRIYTSMDNIPVYYPWVMLFILTPPLLGLFAIGGLFFSLKSLFQKNKNYSLIFLWIFIPLSRFFFPRSSIAYDQIRHFFEVVPGLIILAGIAIFEIYKWLLSKNRIWRVVFVEIVSVLIIYNFTVMLTYRPYGTAYFNIFAGPPEYVNHAFDVEYWGNVYREAGLYVKKAYGEDKKYYTAGLGANIFEHNGFKGKMTDDSSDDFQYAMFMNKQSWLRGNSYALWLINNKKPIFTIERGGKILFYMFLPNKEEYMKYIP